MENKKIKNKSLICITSCNRLGDVKKYIWDYIVFCNKNERFDFLLALDGNSTDYTQFCNEFEIPLLYSDEREGVGLSKNRVLKQFPNYEYYFFIEDDIELLNSSVFQLHIDVAEETGYPHFIVSGMQKHMGTFLTKSNILVNKAEFGGGTFNFFTKKGLEAVGGWHTIFAKHKRYGHTEHTYRFFNAGLQPAPFLVIEEALKMILIHPAPHVTQKMNQPIDNRFIEDEGRLFHQKLKHFPLNTLADFYFNNCRLGYNLKVERFLQKNNKKYPFLKGVQRRKAFAEYHFLQLGRCKNFKCRVITIFCVFLQYPLHMELLLFVKHRLIIYVKRVFK